jgi:ribosomal protein L22
MADEKTPDELDEQVADLAVDPSPEDEAPGVGGSDISAEETEAPAEDAPAGDEPADEPAEAPEPDVADEPQTDGEADVAVVAEEAPAKKPRRSRAKKDEPVAEAAPAPKPAKPAGEVRLVRAQAKYVRTSARKARLVCDHIRGKSVDDARAVLALTPRHVARDWSKLLESAVANAENNHELVGDDLKIVAVKADEGPTLKRFQPRAMGRATKIRKRTSHLTITLGPKE